MYCKVHKKFWILALPQRYKHTQWLENNAFIVLSKRRHLASTNKKSFPGNWWQNDLFVTSASPLHQDSANRSFKTSGKWGSRYWWNSSPLVTPLTLCSSSARQMWKYLVKTLSKLSVKYVFAHAQFCVFDLNFSFYQGGAASWRTVGQCKQTPPTIFRYYLILSNHWSIFGVTAENDSVIF